MKQTVFKSAPYVLCVSIHCKLGTIPLSLPLWDFIKQGSVQLRPFPNSSSFHLSTSICLCIAKSHKSFLLYSPIWPTRAHTPCYIPWPLLWFGCFARLCKKKRGQTVKANLELRAVFIKSFIIFLPAILRPH